MYGLKVFDNNNYLLLNYFSIFYFSFIHGEADWCDLSGNNTLPDGLEVTNKGIEGIVSSVDDFNEYEIECGNSYTITNTLKVSFSVSNSLFHGVKAHFFKINYFDDTLMTKYTPSSDGINIDTIIYLNSIHLDVNEYEVSPGYLSNDFKKNYGCYFEDYIYTHVNGRWYFEISAEGGIWMNIDGNEVISVPGKMNYNNKTEIYVDLDIGYHLLELFYIHGNGPTGLDIKWKSPNSNKFVMIESNNYIKTESNIMFNKTYATYTLDDEMTIPVIVLDTSIKRFYGYISNPELPKGIIYNPYIMDYGALTGIAEEVTNNFEKYNITLFNDYGNYSVIIYLYIKGIFYYF